jgi:hypothetical protein
MYPATDTKTEIADVAVFREKCRCVAIAAAVCMLWYKGVPPWHLAELSRNIHGCSRGTKEV